jgi:hypothetical protein
MARHPLIDLSLLTDEGFEDLAEAIFRADDRIVKDKTFRKGRRRRARLIRYDASQ